MNEHEKRDSAEQATSGGSNEINENGCTYHSGRVSDSSASSDELYGSYKRSYDSQGNSRSFGSDTSEGARSAAQGKSDDENQSSEYGMNKNGEYRYSYEDYNRISYDPSGVDGSSEDGGEPPRRGKSGIKVFAIIITVLLIVTAAILAGVVLSSSEEEVSSPAISVSSAPALSEESKESSSDTPQESSSSHENIRVPELTITSHEEEDTYIRSDGKLTTTQIYEKVRPSVVGILNYSAENPLTASSSGSGILVSGDGFILTNAHVISGAAGLVVVLDNNEEYAATVIGADTTTDLAVIKIDAENLTAATLGDSDQLKVGEKVVAIGNPAGLNLAGSTTEGIVSGLERTISVTLDSGESISMEVIQTDAAINPGNSGGPLINEYGQVIGINSSRLSSSNYNGIGFAIPINHALPIMEDLIRYGYVTGRVKLGITYYPISEVVGAMSGYTPGLLVYSVDTTMDIYAKGLRAGDIITEIDGVSVTSKEDLKTVLEEKSPGDTLTVTFVRGNSGAESTYTVTATLGEDTGNSDTSSYSTETGGASGVPTAAGRGSST